MNIREKKIYFLFLYKNLYLCSETRFVSSIGYTHHLCNHYAILEKRLEYIPSSLLIFVGQNAFFSTISRLSDRLFSNKSRLRIASRILLAKIPASSTGTKNPFFPSTIHSLLEGISVTTGKAPDPIASSNETDVPSYKDVET